MLQEFEGKVAVVTGAASGIGRALVARFVDEGMKVVLADVEGGALREVAGGFESRGADVFAMRVDVSQAEDLSALAEATLERFGGVHVVCNNAGVFAGGLSWEAPASDWEWVLGVNTFGVLHGIRAFVPILLEQNEPAHVVNTVSMAGLITMPLSGPYTMSKHAALCLSETLYHELRMRQSPVGVSALCPELVDTAIGRSDRNRPAHLKRPEVAASPERDLVEEAIRTSTAGGVDPARMADRVVEGIREDRFYLLAEEETSWADACLQRLEDIRLRRNPTIGRVGEAN
ncbi:MAG: SDR family NAD(P)-dependent oxidoreductase [Deltaproteobacteria bacterium]|nr:SDR family NAD(P)-dependent oxidoreductase [Deltaproteobacteria bacterium]